MGGVVLSGRDSGIVVDMGGTTTDIAVVRDGRPAIREEGAEVGSWLTRVKAAEITTIGLGGDSFIQVTADDELQIGPQKVFPLSWIAGSYPHLRDELKNIDKSGYHPVNAQPTSIFVHIKDPAGLNLTGTEQHILELIRGEPHSLHWIARRLGMDPDIIGWERLVTIGAIHRANLTPTDILHVTGDFLAWDRNASEIGLRIMSARYGCSIDRFIEEFSRRFSLALFGLIFEKGLVMDSEGEVTGQSEPVHYFTGRRGGLRVLERLYDDAPESVSRDFRFFVNLTLPVIAVGAPAAAYFPNVVSRFHTDLIIPDSSEVANAVGTVTGKVEARVRVLIKPGETGGYYVYTPVGRKIFRDLPASLEHGEQVGRRHVEESARVSGAHNIEVQVARRDRYGMLSGGTRLLNASSQDEDNRIFIESILEITATGNPW
jgi:N-methylhydantoinase A/oxoprolinase/acetone carboxylase beta subunit